MPSVNDFSASGRIIQKSEDGREVVFRPARTTYELFFACPGYDGPIDVPVEARLRVSARKVYSVPSGGNFVAPIFGPPRTIQGRVLFADETQLVVHAGTPFVVELPPGQSAIDLNAGAIAVGSLVNVVALPGAAFELVSAGAAGVEGEPVRTRS